MTTVDRLPPSAINDLSRQHRPLAAELSEALLGVLDSGWYVLGANAVTFEQAFADYCGVPFAVGVANGTDALELALAAVGVGPGDPVALAANAGAAARRRSGRSAPPRSTSTYSRAYSMPRSSEPPQFGHWIVSTLIGKPAVLNATSFSARSPRRHLSRAR